MSNIDFSSLCRICLTKTSEMVPLKSSFEQSLDDNKTNLIIIDVLGAVFNFSPKLCGPYPQLICLMCLEVLKTVYNFKILFEESRQIVQQCLGEIEENVEPIKPIVNTLNESKASVELIAGYNKYDLNDLVIVEEEYVTSKQLAFQGFLRNLGNTITASFVETHKDTKLRKSVPEIEIKKMSASDSEDSSATSTKTRIRSSMLDEFILFDGEKVQKPIEMKYSEDNIEHMENIDKELLKSAMKLKYECTLCNKVFSTDFRYKKHIHLCTKEFRITKDNKGKQTGVPKLQCQHCNKLFKQQKYLNYHISISHKNLIFTCEICNLRLKTKRAYSYHKLTKHSEAKHICQHCGKRFVVSASLKLHIQNHTNRDTTQCICPVCGKTFHYKGGLFYHMKQHTNERKYQCEYCDKNFYTLFAKQRHVRTHTGIRPYACRYCEKKFFSLGERKRHEYIHTGTLPFRCQHCEKGFTSRYNLKVHWFNHSGDFTCEICNRSFIDNDVLQFHYKLKHKELVAEDSQ